MILSRRKSSHNIFVALFVVWGEEFDEDVLEDAVGVNVDVGHRVKFLFVRHAAASINSTTTGVTNLQNGIVLL